MCSSQERNSTLALENESQREQYERCLDEVSSGLCLSRLTPGARTRDPLNSPGVLLTLKTQRVCLLSLFSTHAARMCTVVEFKIKVLMRSCKRTLCFQRFT